MYIFLLHVVLWRKNTDYHIDILKLFLQSICIWNKIDQKALTCFTYGHIMLLKEHACSGEMLLKEHACSGGMLLKEHACLGGKTETTQIEHIFNTQN